MRNPARPLSVSAAGIAIWGGFAADVAALRHRIAGPAAVCNMLRDRHAFMTALAAAMLNGQTTLLPSATAPEAVRAALDGAGDALLLGDVPDEVRRLPGAGPHLPGIASTGAIADPAPLLDALATAAGEVHVFTSGSTGLPVRHRKTWGTLAGGAAITEAILLRAGLDPDAPAAILGTTPHQHMYGLEAAVFSGLAHGRCLHRGTVFYPADLERAAAEAAEAGLSALVLVTSPAHLRFLEDAVLATPALRLVISATAPLPEAQAARLEARGDLRVFEIYGSTETGSLAARRTVEGPEWEPMAGFTLENRPEGCLARAPHLDRGVLLGDALELGASGRFRLLGRLGEMVHIAGKRTSLGALNAAAVETPGIADAVVIRRRTDGDDELSVLAVRCPSASLSEAECRAALGRQLRRHVDPVFVPRRIRFVDSLPRGATGKIAAQDMARLEALVAPDA